MDLRFSPAELAFRDSLRGWLAQTLPTLPPRPHRDDWPARRRFDTGWQRRLFDAGYAGVDWPAEHGGRGASPTEQLIFLEETAAARAPYVGANFVGLLHAGPTLIVAGTEQQRAAQDRIITLAYTIAAGTSQIQKNILAERALGLPKELGGGQVPGLA